MSDVFVVAMAGSSSIKFGLHETRAPFTASQRGLIEGSGAAARLRLRDAGIHRPAHCIAYDLA